ncbi:MAG: IS1634 family transposase [FCB group bacterium]|nr:IS1634 family transposase [FCB group bacterium]
MDISKSGPYRRVLLRESYRKDGKVKKRTIANLSNCSDEDIAILQLALRNAERLPELLSGAPTTFEMSHGKSVGAVFVAAEVARLTGVTQSLGSGRQADLALWQIIARLIDQGSRLSAVRLHHTHALAEAIALKEGFCEDDLYKNLAWLADHQAEIEDRLFKKRHTDQKVDLFLYDVTSSYLEGTHNELGSYGYNRDGKKGKMQIVIGLLCDPKGDPVSVQVFSGNTSDVTTFSDQVKKVANRFGCERITFVGDRGMIKSAQKEELTEISFNYITALTRKQIETLEKNGIIQLGLFDEKLCEVEKDSLRYILRRNPCRADDIAETRSSKEAAIKTLIQTKNTYLADHPRAQVEAALREIKAKIQKLNAKWLATETEGRVITLRVDTNLLTEISRLDGCYVITTDLPTKAITAQKAHGYYKDLSKVERAFRESKTGHLELRPIHVRKEKSTRGHVFVVMLAYLLRRELERAWDKIDVTMEEGLDSLATLSSVDIGLVGEIKIEQIPKPNGLCQKLLEALKFTIPTKIVRSKLNVSTKVKTRKQR